ncbi:MAG: ABC transporter ATP-binding protein [Desulfurococcaceae archaeon]
MILETKDLCKYFGGIKAVEGVNIFIKRGELLGIIGPNGAGKTTLFNLITGYLKPTKGKIIYERREIQGLPPAKIVSMGIARTFQIVRPFKNLSVFENVLIACGLKNYYGLSFVKRSDGDEYLKKAEGIVKKLGLEDYAHVPAKNLPLGYLKRLEIARALALDPKLLLLDEVMSGLNKIEIEEVKGVIKEVRSMGLTVVLVEHNVPVAVELSDRMYVLNFGKVIAEGSPEEIVRDKRVIEAYLGEEYAIKS